MRSCPAVRIREPTRLLAANERPVRPRVGAEARVDGTGP